MIQCNCGKTLEKVPKWLSSAKVVFVCNNCPNRQTKSVAFLSLETEAPVAAKVDSDSETADGGLAEN